MKSIFTLILIALTLGMGYTQPDTSIDFRIAFGSCFKHREYGLGLEKSKIFESIHNLAPDYFIWLGDFAYVDLKTDIGKFDEEAYNNMKNTFLESYNDPHYTLLRESSTKIIGIWDDHDFGINDGTKFNPIKFESRSLFLDMLDEPK